MGNKSEEKKRTGKTLFGISKSELIQKILKIDSQETEKHLRKLPRKVLVGFVEKYRKYNEIAE